MQQTGHRIVTPFVLVVLLAVSLPAMVHSYAGLAVRIIRTGSMEPALSPGDAVVVHAVPAASLARGDIALLFHPDDGDIEAHRLVTTQPSDYTVSVVTKGDANPMSDAAVLVPKRAAIERVVLRLPGFGYFLASIGSIQILGSVCALGLMVLIAIEMQDRRRKSVAAPESITQ